MTLESGPLCLSVINMKGGVGKTTIAASLATIAARRYARKRSPRRVLAIDLDPQANLSQALMGGPSYQQFLDKRLPSVAEVFDGYQPPTASTPSAGTLSASSVVQPTRFPNLRVLPSRFDFSDRLSSVLAPDPRCLARLIANEFQDEDLIIIDCAPTESLFTTAAYHASRYILVPVRPEFFATIGFPLLNDSLQQFRHVNRGHHIDVIGIVVNDATYLGNNRGGPERRTAIAEIQKEAKESGWHIFDNQIAYSRGFPKIMRGDNKHLGNATKVMDSFANEFFTLQEMSTLELGP